MKKVGTIILLAAACGLAAAGCSKNSSSQSSTSTTTAASPGAMSNMAAPAGGDAARGKQLFTQNCATCHGATGTEGGVGPSLRNEKSRKNMSQAIAWIKNPKPPMPKLYPSPLSEKDVTDLAAYVETL
ncbi:MAG: cytochrome c [Candidatus Eremiobacteraeota bacterium]|nr:cytochrome c [Candidatus Eremiobacteraeota bacterium]